MQQVVKMNTVKCVLTKVHVNTGGCSAMIPVYHRDVQIADSLCHRMQQSRNTLLFERMFPVKPCKKERTGPLRPILKRREFVYKMVENTLTKPQGDMDVILATDIDGLGLKGDVVRVSKLLARTHMLPVGVAEYVTPENLNKYESIRKARENEQRQTMTALQTAKKLSTMNLLIPMSSSIPWKLNKTHVIVAFRIAGVELTEDCIELPSEEITSHKTVSIGVTINGMEKVSVKAIIYPHTKASSVTLPPVWPQVSAAAKFDIWWSLKPQEKCFQKINPLLHHSELLQIV